MSVCVHGLSVGRHLDDDRHHHHRREGCTALVSARPLTEDHCFCTTSTVQDGQCTSAQCQTCLYKTHRAAIRHLAALFLL